MLPLGGMGILGWHSHLNLVRGNDHAFISLGLSRHSVRVVKVMTELSVVIGRIDWHSVINISKSRKTFFSSPFKMINDINFKFNLKNVGKYISLLELP